MAKSASPSQRARRSGRAAFGRRESRGRRLRARRRVYSPTWSPPHFSRSGLARVAGKYPTRANELRAFSPLRRRHRRRRLRSSVSTAADAAASAASAAADTAAALAADPAAAFAATAAACAAADAFARRRRRHVGRGSGRCADASYAWARIAGSDTATLVAGHARMGDTMLGLRLMAALPLGEDWEVWYRLVRGSPARRIARRGLRTRFRKRTARGMGQRPRGGERMDSRALAGFAC